MSELYNPYDPAVQADPYPIYQVLREESPVYWNKEQEFWALSRFDDIWAATQDHRRFSSAKGIVVGQDLAAGMGDLMPMMIMMDPPTALRSAKARVPGLHSQADRRNGGQHPGYRAGTPGGFHRAR